MPSGVVTTIIPVYNRSAMLGAAVESVLAQTYRPIEIIVVDDGSTDDTPAACDQLASAHPDVIRVLHQPNRGPGPAREAGRQMARGEYVQYLDSDDVLLPNKFASQVAALEASPHCGVASGWTRLVIDGVSSDDPWKRTGEWIETMFPSMLQSRWWATPTPLYRATLLRRNGAWTDLRMEEDWEYDCRMAAFGVRIAHVEEWVSESRFHRGGQLSIGAPSKEKPALRERARAHALILQHARAAGIGADVPEMRHFARELFLLARVCGAAGLSEESRMLFNLARDASGNDRNRAQFRLYRAVAGTVGWSLAGKLAVIADRARAAFGRSA